MAHEPSTAILDPLRRLISRQTGNALTDAQLLENFVSRREEASFEVLVWRHGAMVLALAQRVLRDSHAAEDAFQATFLVFARKAKSIGRGEAVACWLYKVAYRIAVRLRARAVERQLGTEPADEFPAPEVPTDAEWRDLRPVLDDEIARLPEKYRAPFVLCYLEGRTNEEAATQLGCPKGTVLSRLSRGRERLRERLSRRGIALTASALAVSISRNAATATVPPTLVPTAVNAAIPFAAGKAVSELVPAHVAALTDGVLRAMTFRYVKTAALALVSLVVLGSGVTWAAFAGGNAHESGEPLVLVAESNGPPTGEAKVVPPVEPEHPAPPIQGRVTDIAKDGKSVTITSVAYEWYGRNRLPEVPEPRVVVVKLSDKTVVTYQDVGMNGAKLTRGYSAYVEFVAGAKDVAAAISLTGTMERPMNGGAVGRVDTVADDGKSFSLEVPGYSSNPALTPNSFLPYHLVPPLQRDRASKIDVPFDDKTVLSFSDVPKGGAKITPNYRVQVVYADDGRTAGKVYFEGRLDSSGREANRPDVANTVWDVWPGPNLAPVDGKPSDIAGIVMRVADGKAIVVEVPPKPSAEAPTRVAVYLTDKTAEVFRDVPLDGAKAAPGMQAQVWLADGSKDTAAKVTYTGTTPDRWTIVTGKVVTVAKDGKSFTVESPPPKRGDAGKRTEVKLVSLTKVTFNGVGPGEAKVTEGLNVYARMLDDYPDTAAGITFTKDGFTPR
ncbi:sigma-70 family rna polymerase sigma factor : RNA polymerase sigma factor, sigma-70 family OS=Singulisphaera acidiphila (strain ATCC BAA-1392 / DSM 18658 / VKM B-2454 / MOB10) GN=Sinac_6419 PE=4 SV=1: Sigma70_r2: Sigma70_r4_2 [Gemmata massiliana]|uniref:ECF RNA polymerase sigma factor SigE n=1 Tax=Gemmata massiliana TaxID=1210884 RepID=A0A6P2CX58_9BACT|nr:RNA polymerase sigma factor [Gemmata massiliana]VTR93718.1 sigma-70 family rna polymerase sigma factor : RNA polymerase sigma factor, sigma-70 family OS=Singulisphaera acidiphila (strain ATCC BAA-1392 / DSM 18658 / VKM B-2454 / MOB10) GN=Sinac_6419 PE=4 SV=1: Sigma70_r2: Sigma70_r4_2 [Gemmata massiliana]